MSRIKDIKNNHGFLDWVQCRRVSCTTLIQQSGESKTPERSACLHCLGLMPSKSLIKEKKSDERRKLIENERKRISDIKIKRKDIRNTPKRKKS